MNNPFPKDRLFAIVKETLSRVLGLPPDEIDAQSELVGDLGAESLDFVELNALLERGLNFTLPTRSVLDHAGRATGHPERFHGARTGLTAAGVALLAASPYRYRGLAEGATMYDIFNTSTVENLANICHAIFDHLPGSCPDCGGHEAQAAPAGKVTCAACGTPLKPLRGDEVLARWLASYLSKDTATHAP